MDRTARDAVEFLLIKFMRLAKESHEKVLSLSKKEDTTVRQLTEARTKQMAYYDAAYEVMNYAEEKLGISEEELYEMRNRGGVKV